MVRGGEALKNFIYNNNINLNTHNRELNRNLCILCGYISFIINKVRSVDYPRIKASIQNTFPTSLDFEKMFYCNDGPRY